MVCSFLTPWKLAADLRVIALLCMILACISVTSKCLITSASAPKQRMPFCCLLAVFLPHLCYPSDAFSCAGSVATSHDKSKASNPKHQIHAFSQPKLSTKYLSCCVLAVLLSCFSAHPTYARLRFFLLYRRLICVKNFSLRSDRIFHKRHLAALLMPFWLFTSGQQRAANQPIFFFQIYFVQVQRNCYYEKTNQTNVVLFKRKQIVLDVPSEFRKILTLAYS